MGDRIDGGLTIFHLPKPSPISQLISTFLRYPSIFGFKLLTESVEDRWIVVMSKDGVAAL